MLARGSSAIIRQLDRAEDKVRAEMIARGDHAAHNIALRVQVPSPPTASSGRFARDELLPVFQLDLVHPLFHLMLR